jgi:hypothetical protein
MARFVNGIRNGVPLFHYQVWLRWSDYKGWPSVWTCEFSSHSFLDAQDFAENKVSRTGGKIARIEVRERGAGEGRALWDASWGPPPQRPAEG